jgi:hypothetical protein
MREKEGRSPDGVVELEVTCVVVGLEELSDSVVVLEVFKRLVVLSLKVVVVEVE